MKDWQRVEAILFGSGKYLTEDQLVQLSGVPKKNLKKALHELKKHYEDSETSLAVFNENDAWKLNVKEEFSSIVKNVISEAEMAKAVMETLAIIAYKSPVLQSVVIDMRGAGAYDHIALLEEKEFITKEKFGRTFKLKIAQKFYEYFDMPDSKLRKMFKDAKKPEVVGNLEIYNQDKTKHKDDEENAEKAFDAKILDRMKKLEETPHDEEEKSRFLNEFDRKYAITKTNIDETDKEMNEFRRVPDDASHLEVTKGVANDAFTLGDAASAGMETDGAKMAKQLEEEIDALESIKASAADEEDESKGTDFFAGEDEEKASDAAVKRVANKVTENAKRPRKSGDFLKSAKAFATNEKASDDGFNKEPYKDPDFRPKKKKSK